MRNQHSGSSGPSPLIVYGAGRTGSTLLMSILKDSKTVLVPGDTPYEQGYLRYFRGLHDVLRAKRGAAPNWDRKAQRTADLAMIGPMPFSAGGPEGRRALADDMFGNMCASLFRRLTEERGNGPALHYAEKGDHVLIDFLRAFGAPKVIMLTRDPRDTFVSIRDFTSRQVQRREAAVRGFGWNENVETSRHATRLIAALAARFNHMAKLDDVPCFVLPYETMIGDREAAMAGLEAFLGGELPRTPSVDQFAMHGTSATPSASIGKWIDDAGAREAFAGINDKTKALLDTALSACVIGPLVRRRAGGGGRRDARTGSPLERDIADRLLGKLASMDRPRFLEMLARANIGPDLATGPARLPRAYVRALNKADEGDVERLLDLLDARAVVLLTRDADLCEGLARGLTRSARPEETRALVVEACERRPDHPGPALVLKDLLLWHGDREGLRRLIDAREDLLGQPEMLLSLGERFPLRPEEEERVRKHIRAFDAETPADTSSAAFRWLFAREDWQLAQDILGRLTWAGLDSFQVSSMVQLLRAGEQRTLRPEPVPGHDDLRLGHSEGDHTLAIVFAGLGDATTFLSSLIDGHMASLGISTLTVRDMRKLLCMTGLESVEGGRAEAVSQIRAIAADLGIDRIVTMGVSAGGFPAIVYGLELGATASLCFSPPSIIAPSVLMADPRMMIIQRRLGDALREEEMDLLHWLDALPGPMRITACYGAEHERDRMQAERLAGRPGVTLHPIEGSSLHNSVLGYQGNLADLFAEALGADEQAGRAATNA